MMGLYIRGREAYYDDEIYRWQDNNEPVPGWGGSEERPCPECGLTAEDPENKNDAATFTPDPCLGFLPDCDYACCGHGNTKLRYVARKGEDGLAEILTEEEVDAIVDKVLEEADIDLETLEEYNLRGRFDTDKQRRAWFMVKGLGR